MEQIKVSVICTAYNHEKYIRETLEGFVRQKTNFDFEVVVHDDASTDKTAEIIREYQKKYPDIIKPIFQTENQYSKGIRISFKIVLPKTKGKYIAFCEGDDFWCDENKLQKQFDYMESHPECSMSSHPTYKITELGENIGILNGIAGIYTLEDILDYKAPAFHTSSRFLRREVYENYSEVFLNCTIGDWPTKINAALQGKINYLPDVMSKYRIFSEGSWTSRVTNDTEYLKKNKNSVICFLKELKKYTNGKYDERIDYCIDRAVFGFSYLGNDYKQAKKTNIYKCSGFKKKLVINLGIYFPWLLKLVKKVIK